MKINKIGKTALACIISLSTVTALTNAVHVDSHFITNINAQETGHITINANVGDDGTVQSLAGKKFNIYKIFDAQNSAGMESINYTMNSVYEQALKNATGKDTEYAIIDYIQTLNTNVIVNDVSHTQKNETRYSEFRYFVEKLRNEIVKLQNEPTQVVTVPEDAKESFTLDVDFGWYIVDEVTNVVGEHSASSLCMVNTANPDVFINIKSDFPVIQKQIREDDTRASVGKDHDGWNDVADFEIGQTVPYRYLTYVPNMNGYNTYYFSMHDRMDSALTFNPDSVVVKVGKFTLEKDIDYKIVTEGIPEDETFQIQIMDLKNTVNKYFYADEADANPETEKIYGQEIVVEYNATLNDSAQLTTGRPGFENDVKLEFSNNPDSDGQGQTGETPWDTVVAFTFRTNGVKVNDQNPELKLEGAKFRLYSDKECKNEVYVKKATATDGYIVINRDSVTGNTAPDEAVEMVSDKNGMFNIIGLDSQTYYLKETVAPDGYRLLKDPIQIDIKATYAEQNRDNYIKGDGATDKTLQKLEATAHFKEFYNQSFNEYDNNLTTSVEDGSINLKVVNKVGSKLPATGSIATIILIGAGTAIMVSVLIKNRKKEVDAK
ncbi:MAG: isopeptide-forming domain-containing fimbrial protein [Thomasclavelia spiroformis]|uniref:isopeptide-forming domain-containing fimbrial protein n=1 Tax=Thomasclavelia spiroformis TaxID=29348 RepID=UPI003993C6D8